MTIRNQSIFYLLFLLLLVRTAPEAFAQGYTVDIKPVRGFMPTADQVSSPIDSIDPVSGKLHTSIPLASLPRGRAGNTFDVTLQYDSHLYDITPQVRDYTIDQYGHTEKGTALVLEGALSTGGWTYNFANFRLDLETRYYESTVEFCPGGTEFRIYRLRIGLPDGSQHILQLKDEGDAHVGDAYEFHDDGYFGVGPDGKGARTYYPNGNPTNCWTGGGWGDKTGRLTYYTTDGSYLRLEIDADGTTPWINKTWYLYFPDGSIAEGKWHQIEKLRDPNGNAIIFENTLSYGYPTLTKIYHEEDGPNSDRAVIITYDLPNYNSNSKTDTISVPGPNGRITWTVNWEYLFIGGNGRKYYSTSASSIYQWELTDPYGAALWVVKNVQLPLENATAFPNIWNSYVFEYSGDATCGYGELKSIRTPSNSTYTYGYVLENPPDCLTALTYVEWIVNQNHVVQRVVAGPGIQTLTTNYVPGNGITEITAPDLGKTSYKYDELLHLVYQIEEPNGSIRKRVWAQNKVYDNLSTTLNLDPNNPYIQKETVTVGNSSGAPSKTTVTEYTVDKNGNPLQQIQYDWVDYNPNGIENGVTPKRITHFDYYLVVPEASNTSNHGNAYWNSTASNPSLRLNAVHRKEISDGAGNNSSVTEFGYDNPFGSGNLTTEARWNNFSDLSTAAPGLGGLDASNSQVLTRHYDSYGNLRQIDEPEVPTSIAYDADGPFPVTVEYAYTSSEIRTWNYAWLTDGSLQSKIDNDNGIATTFTYDDVGRPKTVIDTVSGNSVRRTLTEYDDANRKVTTKRDLVSINDGKLQSITHYDELGRVTLTQASDGSPLNSDTDGIKVSTNYITFTNGIYPGGHRVVTSTPYRTTSDPTLEWSCSQTDPLGRVTDVGIFSGSVGPSDCTSSTARTGLTHTDFNADQVTVTDPASKVRREIRDGLGRLTTVVEDPGGPKNYPTTYTYDPLDRLTQVNQDSQERRFHYSSLGLLKDAYNPETDTIGYTYTNSGDLATRTDARGFSTTYGYDGLHRVLTKSYSGDGGVTPNVTYAYYPSGAPLGSVGQLQSMTSSAATVSYAYDVLWRIQTNTQTTGGNAYTFQYSYRLDNGLASMQYPSGKTVNYANDDAGRVNKVSTTGKTYADLTASSSPFTADGRIAQMKFGNEPWETRVYHTPGIPTLLKLGTSASGNDKLELEYDFSGTANNGNLLNQVIRQPGHTWTQSFSYDEVNRLTAASETGGFSQTYGYDQYGNRWVSASSGITVYEPHEPIAASQIDTAHNRIGNQNYDAAGNQLTYDPRTLAYDAENRMISATSIQNGNEYYIYDGDGLRVRKTWMPNGGSPQVTTYVYGLTGQLAAEYTNQISATTGTSWIFEDLLGSVRSVSGEKPQSGAAQMTECYDYLPFGRLLSANDNARNTGCYPTSPDSSLSSVESPKFTGQVRDIETGLDYYRARYMSAAEGRFASPDPLFASAHLAVPQSWNRYEYAGNNPLRYVDPSGMDYYDANGKRVGSSEDDENYIITDKDEIKKIKKSKTSVAVGSLNSAI